MGLCVKCKHMYVPDFMWQIDADEAQCVFCKIGKTYITIDKENGGEERYTQKEARADYIKFLRLLKDKPGISKKIMDAGSYDKFACPEDVMEWWMMGITVDKYLGMKQQMKIDF